MRGETHEGERRSALELGQVIGPSGTDEKIVDRTHYASEGLWNGGSTGDLFSK